jgi:adenine-specific DNA methylase
MKYNFTALFYFALKDELEPASAENNYIFIEILPLYSKPIKIGTLCFKNLREETQDTMFTALATLYSYGMKLAEKCYYNGTKKTVEDIIEDKLKAYKPSTFIDGRKGR